MRSRSVPLLLALSLLPTAPAIAHHSFAMFDSTKVVTLKGTVKDFQWGNPHVWIQLLVPGAKGGTVEYGVECRSVNMLVRGGWQRGTLKPGDKITLTMHPLKSGAPGGALMEVRLPSGKRISGVPTDIPADDFSVK